MPRKKIKKKRKGKDLDVFENINRDLLFCRLRAQVDQYAHLGTQKGRL